MELREAFNEIILEGILKEKEIETKTIKTQDGDKEVISGDLVITDKANSEHKVKVFAGKLTKDGKENPVYKSLLTVMKEYVSIAEALKAGKTADDADKVRITKGKLSLNEYYTPNGELRSFPQVSTNFINRVTGDYNPRAEFSVEVYFDSITPEIKDSEETGRLILKVILPLYGGTVVPLTLVASDPDVVNYIQSNYEKGKTGKIWGELVNSTEIIKTVEQGFGKAKEKITTKILNELVVTGGEESQYEDDDKNSYPTDLIKKAMAERDVMLDNLLKKSKDGSKKGSSKSGGTTTKKELNF